jgi:hypothetical protein
VPASDVDTVVVDSLKALDPDRPIREEKRTYLLRWSRFAGQAGGLAKVDSGLDYAANFSSFACVA